MAQKPKDEKVCLQCGRPFTWRKKWKNCWDEVKYCSKRCRNDKKANKSHPVQKTI